MKFLDYMTNLIKSFKTNVYTLIAIHAHYQVTLLHNKLYDTQSICLYTIITIYSNLKLFYFVL